MKIFIFNSSKYAGEYVAIQLMKAMKKNPKIVLGLSTGLTMMPFYAELIKIYKNEKLSFSEVKTFNLDEYYDFGEDDKESLRSFMDKYFFSKVDVKDENINFLNGKNKDYKKECNEYEKKIKDAGGIDLMILGIGINSHIGFNEPGSAPESVTRKIKLSAKTKEVNRHFFKDRIPEYAVTMGIKTIMGAKKIILLGLSKRKSEAIFNSFGNPPNVKYPASFLQQHKNASLILDKVASSNFIDNKEDSNKDLFIKTYEKE